QPGRATRSPSNLRSDAEARRLCAGVARDLRGARADRTARRRAYLRLRTADADREVRRARAALLLPPQELLHDPVLERVERDDAEAALRPEELQGGRQGPLERAELVVDVDPQGLEDALRGVTLAEAGGRGHRLLG